MRYFLMILTAFALISCGKPSKFKTYNGPQVTQILVDKTARKMWLLHGTKALKSYKIDLGFAPAGHKFKEGDGRTPEGVYRIDRRNPNSSYHLSLGINYPNNQDRAKAHAAGVSPGGDIFIHGGPVLRKNRKKADWTAGCISVTNKEMEEIYAMVKDGTPILVKP
ncbi:MAG: L,D-transpeptidase family protein [Amylibacter sp.]|jgi:murein L,D-transpeptidase YafK|nr:L,D-transpeptidase family protein [Amylibacter sp.]